MGFNACEMKLCERITCGYGLTSQALCVPKISVYLCITLLFNALYLLSIHTLVTVNASQLI